MSPILFEPTMDRTGLRKFIDACYSSQQDRAAWLLEIARALGPLVSPRQGVVLSLHAHGSGAAVGAAGWGHAEHLVSKALSMRLPADVTARAFAPFTVSRLSRQLGLPTMRGLSLWDDTFPGYEDAVGMWADDGASQLIATFHVDEHCDDPMLEKKLMRLRRHFAAGFRGGAGRAGASPEDVILDVDGRILHRPDGASAHLAPGSLAVLRHAARAFDRERSGDEPASDALALWDELWSGGWHLIDAADTDGRRMLLLRRVTDDAPEKGFTDLERKALELARRGESLKEIGLALSIPTSTASDYIASGLRKLGLSTRLELVSSLAGRGGPVARRSLDRRQARTPVEG